MQLAWCNGVGNGTSYPNSSLGWRTAPHCPMCGVYSRKIKRPSRRRPGTPKLGSWPVGLLQRSAAGLLREFLGNLFRGSTLKGAHDKHEKPFKTIRQYVGGR